MLTASTHNNTVLSLRANTAPMAGCSVLAAVSMDVFGLLQLCSQKQAYAKFKAGIDGFIGTCFFIGVIASQQGGPQCSFSVFEATKLEREIQCGMK